jgi:hypothetical protein
MKDLIVNYACSSIVEFGDSITFSLNISRTDAMFPTYVITLLAVIHHPLNNRVMDAIFSSGQVISTLQEGNETRSTLDLPELNYELEQGSTLQITFFGLIGDLAFTVQYIELYGTIDYQSDPFNGHTYDQDITFPRVYLRHADFSLNLISTTFEETEDNLLISGEGALCRASTTNIINFGPAANLVILIEVNGTYFNITSTDVHTVALAEIRVASYSPCDEQQRYKGNRISPIFVSSNSISCCVEHFPNINQSLHSYSPSMPSNHGSTILVQCFLSE